MKDLYSVTKRKENKKFIQKSKDYEVQGRWT